MKYRLLFLLFGLALGAVIFWLPTAFVGRNGFALPPFFLFGPWYLVAIPYLVIFALIYGILVGIYRLLKRSFPVSLADVAWTLLGLYLSLTFFFHFVGVAVGGGKLTI
jgi:hypothetical protein